MSPTSTSAPSQPPAVPEPNKKGRRLPQELQLVVCALGIYTCYLRYGLLQERIYKTVHGDGETYSYSMFLIFIQTIINSIFARLVMAAGLFKEATAVTDTKKTDGDREKARDGAKKLPLMEYIGVSLSYLSAMVFSFTALNYMSYPMQALGKSCKMIPVMLMGIVIRKKRYSAREFLCVFLITIGVAMFSFQSKKSKVPTSPLGFALLFASLTMDGITGPLQERLVARHNPSTHQLMFWQNLCAAGWLAVALLVSGEGFRAVSFIRKYPSCISDILVFAIVSGVGQNFIFYTVRNFSALIVTTITTTRKMFTVLLSIFVYNHSMVMRQWLGLSLVFFAISWEAYAKQQAKRAKEATAAPATKKAQ